MHISLIGRSVLCLLCVYVYCLLCKSVLCTSVYYVRVCYKYINIIINGLLITSV